MLSTLSAAASDVDWGEVAAGVGTIVLALLAGVIG